MHSKVSGGSEPLKKSNRGGQIIIIIIITYLLNITPFNIKMIKSALHELGHSSGTPKNLNFFACKAQAN